VGSVLARTSADPRAVSRNGPQLVLRSIHVRRYGSRDHFVQRSELLVRGSSRVESCRRRGEEQQVTCREMDDVISSCSGDSALPPRPAKHLIHCEHCRGLTRLLDKADEGSRPSEKVLQRIQAGILEDLKPVRPLAPSHILLFACAIIFLSVVAVGGRLLGMNGWGALTFAQRAVMFFTLATSAIFLANSMIRQMAPGSRDILAPAVLLVLILVLLLMVIAATFRSQHESAFLANGVMCLKNGLSYSMPAGLLFWLILRRGAMLYPKIIGAGAGGLAGLAGLSALEFNCPNLNVFHILVWHAGVVIMGSLGGTLLGAAVESIERRRRSISRML